MPDIFKSEQVSRLESMRNKNRIKNLFKEKQKKQKDLSHEDRKEFVKNLATSEEHQRVYAEKLVERTTAGIEAQLVAVDMFNMDTMSIGEPHYYTIKSRIDSKDAEVLEKTAYGRPPRKTHIQDGKIVRVTPYQITGPEEEMAKFSLKQGNIQDTEAMEERTEKAISGMIDDDGWDLLEEGLTTDIEDVEGIYIDSRVKQFPNSTDLDMSDEEGITLDVLKTIAEHFDQLGRQIQNIYIPSNRRSDIWDWMSIPAGYDDGSGVDADNVVPIDMHSNIVRTGSVNNLFGYSVNFVPLNILNGDADNGEVYLWVSTNEPAGEYREVPEISYTHTHEDARNVYYQQSRGLAMFQVPNQKLNYMRVRVE